MSSPHRAISGASCLGNLVYTPIYTREELFPPCYLQHSRGLFGAEGGDRRDGETLDCRICKTPINYVEDHVDVISEGEEKQRHLHPGEKATKHISASTAVVPVQRK